MEKNYKEKKASTLMPLLSICIPTYNRMKYLKECLDSVVCQFDDESIYNKIEVIISDNASDDNTKELVAQYQARWNRIMFFRNDENVGAAGNILRLLELPLGKYVWLIGDDDIVSGDSIKYIISKIEHKTYSTILINFDQGEHLNPKIKIHANSLGLKKDKEYDSFINFFDKDDFKNFAGINFLSGLVFNVDLLKKNFYKFSEYLGSCYLQSHIFLILGVNGNILRIAQPLVTWRVGELRRFDKWHKHESQTMHDYNGFIDHAKLLGYMYDEKRKSKIDYKSVAKGYIFNILKGHGIIKYARIIYRIPRLIKYYASRLLK